MLANIQKTKKSVTRSKKEIITKDSEQKMVVIKQGGAGKMTLKLDGGIELKGTPKEIVEFIQISQQLSNTESDAVWLDLVQSFSKSEDRKE